MNPIAWTLTLVKRKDDSEKIDDDDFDDDDDAWVKHYLENQEEIDKRIESMMVDDGLLTRSTEDTDERDPGDLHDVGMEEAVEDPPTATTPPNANSKKQKFHEFCNRKVESGQWNPSKPLPWKKDKELNLFVEDLLGEKGKSAAARWWRELKSAKGMLATVKVTAKKEDLLEGFKRIGAKNQNDDAWCELAWNKTVEQMEYAAAGWAESSDEEDDVDGNETDDETGGNEDNDHCSYYKLPFLQSDYH